MSVSMEMLLKDGSTASTSAARSSAGGTTASVST
jgi:hypothetical protein